MSRDVTPASGTASRSPLRSATLRPPTRTRSPRSSDFVNAKYEQLQVGGYIQHIPTGLFLHGAWLRENLSGIVGGHAAAGMNNLNPEHWYVKAGIRQKWTPVRRDHPVR